LIFGATNRIVGGDPASDKNRRTALVDPVVEVLDIKAVLPREQCRDGRDDRDDRDADDLVDRLDDLVEQALGSERAEGGDMVLHVSRPIGCDQVDEPLHLAGSGQ
jgi:hypothetical protein